MDPNVSPASPSRSLAATQVSACSDSPLGDGGCLSAKRSVTARTLPGSEGALATRFVGAGVLVGGAADGRCRSAQGSRMLGITSISATGATELRSIDRVPGHWHAL